MRLKRLIKLKYNFGSKIQHLPALAETLAHDFVLNGTRYDKALTEAINQEESRRRWFIEKISNYSFPCQIFRIIGLSRINAGENRHVHAVLQILKSLETPLDAFCARPPVDHYCHFHRNQWWKVGACRRLVPLESVCQHRRNRVHSGRVYRVQREKRLMNFQNGICLKYIQNPFLRRSYKNWNFKLVSQFLIPILDQSPKSDKLLALLNRRIRDVFLKYTPRRRLIDAAYRYIRRTSDVGNN